ncbi:MAG: D-galactarolactone cycloisomerase [Armatimonadaceae bacterium]
MTQTSTEQKASEKNRRAESSDFSPLTRLSERAPSRIECIRIYHLQSPMPEIMIMAHARRTHWYATLVQVVDNHGTEGWGECLGPPELILPILEHYYAPLLIGKDPFSFSGIWDTIWRDSFWWARRGALLSAMSGLDMALWDLSGHATGRSLSEMLGTRHRERLPCYATGLYFKERPETEYVNSMVDEALHYVEQGYRAVKCQLGRNLYSDRALVRNLRAALPDTPLIGDACCAYDLPEAAQIGAALEDAGFVWFEDPISVEHPEQYARLAQQLRLPLAAGEWEQTRWGFQKLLTPGGVSLPQIKLHYCGGLTEALRIRSLIHSAGLNLSPVADGTMLNIAASVHFLASDIRQQNRADFTMGLLGMVASADPIRDNVFNPGIRVEGGIAYVPTGPGLGVQVDQDELRFFKGHFAEVTAP